MSQYTTGTDAEVSAEQLRIWIMGATECVEEIDQHHADVTNPADVAHLLADLRDHKARVAEVFSTVEKHLLSVMGEKQLEVPGLGVIESKKRTKRKGWQHDEVFRSVVSRIADEPGVFFDPDEGVLLPSSQIASNLVGRLRDVLSPSWKVTGLRAMGLTPDEFCTEEADGWGVQLPPRDVAA